MGQCLDGEHKIPLKMNLSKKSGLILVERYFKPFLRKGNVLKERQRYSKVD